MSWRELLTGAPSVVTIGKFDGVHVGHQTILADMVEVARERGLESVVVTFDRNPLEVLRPADAPKPLTSAAQRRELITACGVDRVIMIPFDDETRTTEPEDFAQMLFDGAGARVVFVGEDFRFGAKARGDAALLQSLAKDRDIDVQVIDDVCVIDGRRVSSTWIRDALSLGRIRDAASMLGRAPQVRGTVVRGHQRGRELGVPTANLAQDSEGFVPAHGVYAAWATVDGIRYPSAVSVGDNPTFEGVTQTVVEAHLLDVDLDLYDKIMTVDFIDFVRTMHRFTGLEELMVQMQRDIDDVRALLIDEGPVG